MKHRIFSFINIFGLAVGMSVCMLIIMLVANQMMNDRHNPNRDRIFRVNSLPYYDGNQQKRGNETATTTFALHDELLNQYTGVEQVVRLVRGFGNNWIEAEPGHDINIPVSGYFADPEVLEMFSYELLYGDITTALKEPYSVVLTKEAAEKIFKTGNPVGESLKVGELGNYKVTGVIKETENKSHIVVDAFASISTVNSLNAQGKFDRKLDTWFSFHSGWVYLMLEKGKTAEDILPHLEEIHKKHLLKLPTPETMSATFKLQPLMSITPGKMLNNPIGPFMPWEIIYFLSGLAAIILITSCFNFTGLSVARSISRAKEIGVRKVTGAHRFQIFSQFISESIVIALFSLVFALLMLILLKPLILKLPFVSIMHWDLTINYYVIAVFIAFAVTVGILAGFFPAIVLSGFQPIKVLKKMHNTRLMSQIVMRKALLVIQFTVSLILILTVIVLNNQLHLFLHSDYGFNANNKIVLQKGESSAGTLKNELLRQNNITNVSLTSHIPAAGVVNEVGFKQELSDESWKGLKYFSVDEDYIKSMEIPIQAGKFFSAEGGVSNKNHIVINEAAVKSFGFETSADAIGQTIICESDSSQKQIIGVVKDYTHEMAVAKIAPMALMYNPDDFSIFQISYTGTFEDAANDVKMAWTTVNPTLKVEVLDFKEEMGKLYQIIFGSLGKVVAFIATFAIIISCLGLLGMAMFTIEIRKKEISLRKILGITDKSLVYILSKGYLKIILLSIFIAVPIAWYCNSLWLQEFTFHTSVDFVTITIGVGILVLLGLVTIGSQMFQAVFINPLTHLKDE